MAKECLRTTPENRNNLRYHDIEPTVLRNPEWFDFWKRSFSLQDDLILSWLFYVPSYFNDYRG